MKRLHWIGAATLGLAMATQAATIEFSAVLLGETEDPPVTTDGHGTAHVIYDDTAHTLSVHVEFEDLTGTTTVAHIHAPTPDPFSGNASVATYPSTFPGFPSGVQSGVYDGVWSLTEASSYTTGFLSAHGDSPEAAEQGLLQALLDGRAYVNIHSSFQPSGEIRGFLRRVPDGGSTGLLL